jgi:hypothetical protein
MRSRFEPDHSTENLLRRWHATCERKPQSREADLEIFVAPLGAGFIRFGRAADVLVTADPLSTRADMLAMLVHAMWQGAFDPGYPPKDPVARKAYEDAANWLTIPIPIPTAQLTEAQKRLDPSPVGFYQTRRDSIISVMLDRRALPGNDDGWRRMLRMNCDDPIRRNSEAIDAAINMPLSAYSAEGVTFLENIIIARKKLQTWLDGESQTYSGLFVSTPTSDAESVNQVDSGDNEPTLDPKPGRGRKSLPGTDQIHVTAMRVWAEEPKLLNKQVAAIVHERLLACFDACDVPSEATILKKVGEIKKSDAETLH